MTTNAVKTEFHDRIKADIDTAYRAGEKHRTTVLKTLLSNAITNATKTEKRLPTDAEIVSRQTPRSSPCCVNSSPTRLRRQMRSTSRAAPRAQRRTGPRS
jgi:ribosomal protein L22